MNKELNKRLMTIAEEILQSNDCPLYKCPGTIYESYNGQASALGVSTLMIGLKATLAIYYSDAPNKSPKVIDDKNYYDKAYRKLLLDVIIKMLNKKMLDEKKTTNYSTYDFVHTVMQANDKEELEKNLLIKWKTDLINCSVALKHVIRTYKLE